MQILAIEGSAEALVVEVLIISAELSTPWMVPVPLDKVWAILRFRTPSINVSMRRAELVGRKDEKESIVELS